MLLYTSSFPHGNKQALVSVSGGTHVPLADGLSSLPPLPVPRQEASWYVGSLFLNHY